MFLICNNNNDNNGIFILWNTAFFFFILHSVKQILEKSTYVDGRRADISATNCSSVFPYMFELHSAGSLASSVLKTET